MIDAAIFSRSTYEVGGIGTRGLATLRLNSRGLIVITSDQGDSLLLDDSLVARQVLQAIGL